MWLGCGFVSPMEGFVWGGVVHSTRVRSVAKPLVTGYTKQFRAPRGRHKASPSPYDEEIEALRKYRKESTRPNGKLQSFPDEIRKAYRRHAAAIRRLFTKAEKAGHREAVEIVKRSLKPGYYSVLEVDFSCESSGCSNLDS